MPLGALRRIMSTFWPTPEFQVTTQLFIDDLMFDAIEDRVGLWEVVSFASAENPERPLEFARRVVRDLLARGWIELHSVSAADDWRTLRPVERGAVASVIADDANWDQRIIDAAQRYVVRATGTGQQELMADRRRRGLE